jgi:hypothetical protein
VLTSAGILTPDPDGLLGLYLVMDAGFALVGAVLVTRVPDNRVGHVLWAAGLALAIGVIAHLAGVEAYLATGRASTFSTAAILLSLAAIQVTFCLVMTFLPLLYPTGRVPSPRWRPLAWYAAGILVFSIAKAVFAPGPLDAVYAVPNPFGLEALAASWDVVETIDAVLLLTVIAACVLSLLTRYRTGGSVERQQVKWFAAVALLMVVFFAAAVLAPTEQLANLGWGLAILMLPFLPLAIGLAILRYRLYDLDRIVSRSISWALVTGLMGLVFVAGVIALPAALSGFTQGQTVAVAGSTLLAFGVFQPLRRRIQRAVDRRFDRARVDGERTAAAFAERLRSEVAIDAVVDDLNATVGTALRPATQGLWLRRADG